MKLYCLKVCVKLGNPYLVAIPAAGFYGFVPFSLFVCFNFRVFTGTTAGCAFFPSPRLSLQMQLHQDLDI